MTSELHRMLEHLRDRMEKILDPMRFLDAYEEINSIQRVYQHINKMYENLHNIEEECRRMAKQGAAISEVIDNLEESFSNI